MGFAMNALLTCKIKRLFVLLLGKQLATQLRLYMPEGVSPGNIVIVSWLHELDNTHTP